MEENRKNGLVVKVIDDFKLVINLGEEDNILIGDKFLVYYLSEEDIIDPENNKLLGKLEYVVGKGKVIHTQQKMSTIESIEEKIENKKTITKTSGNIFLPKQEEVIEPKTISLPFKKPKVGYKVRKI